MDQVQWEYLESRAFGECIFANDDEGIGLPMMTGEGDLDGDLYFICWDENIITHCSIPININEDADCNDNKDNRGFSFSEDNCESDEDWLKKAQQVMADPRNKCDKKWTGKFYTELKSGKHSDTDNFSLAKAYKQCIDGQKHGGEIKLPDSLAKKIGFR